MACPRCKRTLEHAGDALRCGRCGAAYPIVDGSVDFTIEATDAEWSRRQQAMLEWYAKLSTDPDRTERCFRADYDAIATLLSGLSGTVLDVGGGAGVTRRYLAPSVRYVDVDPSTRWLGEPWAEHASVSAMAFAKATGEALPFLPASFDAVLSLWSLNHVRSPRRVIEECARVLKPGGTLVLALEDMEPRWRDLSSIPRDVAKWTLRRKIATALRVRKWPVQFDHVRIDESALEQWLSGSFQLIRRTWAGPGRPAYLVLVLRRN